MMIRDVIHESSTHFSSWCFSSDHDMMICILLQLEGSNNQTPLAEALQQGILSGHVIPSTDERLHADNVEST